MPDFYKGYQRQSAGPLRSAGSTDMTISTENQDRLEELRSSINALEGIGKTAISRGVAKGVAEDRAVSKVEAKDIKDKEASTKLRAKNMLAGITTQTNSQVVNDDFIGEKVPQQQAKYYEGYDANISTLKDSTEDSSLKAEIERQGQAMKGQSFAAVAKRSRKVFEDETRQATTNIASDTFKKNGYDIKATMKELKAGNLKDSSTILGDKQSKESAYAGLYQDAMGNTKAYEAFVGGVKDGTISIPEEAKALRVLKNANDARYKQEQTQAYSLAKTQVKTLSSDPSILSEKDALGSVNTIIKSNNITDKGKIATLKADAVRHTKVKTDVNGIFNQIKETGDSPSSFYLMDEEHQKEFFTQATGQSEATMSYGSLGINPEGGMTGDLKKILGFHQTYSILPKGFTEYTSTPINNGNADDLSNKLGIVSSGLQFNSDAIHQAFSSKDLNKIQMYGMLLHDQSMMRPNSDEADPKLIKEALDGYDRATAVDLNGHTGLSKVNTYLKDQGKDIDISKEFMKNTETSWTFGNDIGKANNMLVQFSFMQQGLAKGATIKEAMESSKKQFDANYITTEFSNGEQTKLDHKWAPNAQKNLVDYLTHEGYDNPEQYTLINSADTLLTNGMTATLQLNGNNVKTINLEDFKSKISVYNRKLSTEASKSIEWQRKAVNSYRRVYKNMIEQQLQHDL